MKLVLAICAVAIASTAACGSTSTPTDSTNGAQPKASSSASKSPSGDQPASKAVITIKDFKFMAPDSVPAGATVTVNNEDAMAHTVTASGKGGFDVTIKPHATATFTAPAEAGAYPFVCTFHGNMHSVLTIA